jgi:hypothetical protein
MTFENKVLKELGPKEGEVVDKWRNGTTRNFIIISSFNTVRVNIYEEI